MIDTTASTQADTIRQALDLLALPGGVVEIRGLHVPARYGKGMTVAGYFSDLDPAAEAAATLDTRKAAGVYLVLNEVNPALLARSPNMLTDGLTPTTSDADIIRRRWLPLDFDSVRPAGISANEDEHAAAEDMGRRCVAWLASQGWPEPIQGDSGNGWHAVYSIDLPNDEASKNLVRDCLIALAERFDRAAEATIDRSVYNAARIWKMPGTTARKGHPMPDRPHRIAQVVEVPAVVQVVPVEKLKALAAMPRKPEPSRPSTNGNDQFDHRLDVPQWLAARGAAFRVKDRSDSKGRTIYLLEQCPFDSGHGGHGETAIYQAPDGKLGATCKHNACNGRGWQQFRDAIGKPDPDHYDPPLSDHRNNGKATQGNHSREAAAEEKPAEPPAFTKLLTGADLLALDLKPRFLVRGVLVEGQPMIIGGRSKTLKTSVACDLVVSLGSGKSFLGKFDSHRVNVGFWSGESGAAVVRETARRIAAAKGVELADCSAWWSFDLPKLCHLDHLNHLRATIERHGLKVAVIDPLYLSLLDAQTAGQASNLFAMGAALQPLTKLAQEAGVTLIVLHHFRKTGEPDEDEPAALPQLAQSGAGEWARQWILLQRRAPPRHFAAVQPAERPQH